jgi:cytosine/adenosine deaminase-related metal-dependent hydrolase
MEILTASWVLPVAAPPLLEGRVAIDGGRVAWVGLAGDPGEPEGRLRDLGPGVLLPGLVNAHCHLELSHLSGRVPFGDGFTGWVEALVAARASTSALASTPPAGPAASPETGDEVQLAAEAAILALEARGTVAVGDVSNTLGHLHRLAASGLSGVVFLELLAWDPAKAESTLAWAEEQRSDAARSLRPGLDVRLAAHAPHSVSPALLRLLVERGGPAAIHLAESPDETSFLESGGGEWPGFLARRGLGHVAFEPPRKSPVRYAEGLGVLHGGLVAAHGVQVDAADRRRLARRGVHVVVCPRSNRNLRVGRADVPALLAAGVPLALGTDSLASAETLDVLDDAVLLHRQFPGLHPAAIVRMATLGGAEALGLDDLGALASGKRAALAFAAASGERDPYEFLLSGEARLEPVAAR